MIKAIRKQLRPVRRAARRLMTRLVNFRGRLFCPCCGRRVAEFINWREIPAECCPLCGAARRYRLLTLFLPRYTDILDAPGRMLHIAPERMLGQLIDANKSLHRVTADLLRDDVEARVDICNIQFPDNSFDFIMCNHVLEHVPNDLKAMRELRRCLREDGLAILQSPITVERTFEDPSIIDPAERLRIFGQEDHVRVYGPDYRQRLESCGFIIKPFRCTELYSAAEIEHFGLDNEEIIYVCLKDEAGMRHIRKPTA